MFLAFLISMLICSRALCPYNNKNETLVCAKDAIKQESKATPEK